MASDGTSEFTHAQLPDASTHIRLLGFLPSHDGGDIQCSLSAWSRLEAPEYTAISYTWYVNESTRPRSSSLAALYIGILTFLCVAFLPRCTGSEVKVAPDHCRLSVMCADADSNLSLIHI